MSQQKITKNKQEMRFEVMLWTMIYLINF